MFALLFSLSLEEPSEQFQALQNFSLPAMNSQKTSLISCDPVGDLYLGFYSVSSLPFPYTVIFCLNGGADREEGSDGDASSFSCF